MNLNTRQVLLKQKIKIEFDNIFFQDNFLILSTRNGTRKLQILQLEHSHTKPQAMILESEIP